MRRLRLVDLLRDQQGIALPMALLTLLILSTLVIAFAMLATSEPLIATNQKRVAQARAIAESGLERAMGAQ
jgi:type II secretory pathway component PulK